MQWSFQSICIQTISGVYFSKANKHHSVTFIVFLSAIIHNASACHICRAVPYSHIADETRNHWCNAWTCSSLARCAALWLLWQSKKQSPSRATWADRAVLISDTSLYCKTTDTALVHCTKCLFIPSFTWYSFCLSTEGQRGWVHTKTDYSHIESYLFQY